jgi:tRNA (cytidine/uridine-2'-O-)-methyltransferase
MSRQPAPLFHVVLYEPEIPPNTGNIGRLCLSAGCRLHLIEPLGFSLDEKLLRRAGLDYWADVDLRVWPGFEEFRRTVPDASRVFYLTTKSDRPYWNCEFRRGDFLVFGPETRGLPESLLARHAEQTLTIPMPGPKARSLNLATSTGIVLYEALRQVMEP